MTEMIEKLEAALGQARRHADKTLHLAEAANDPANWHGAYGINHPASYIKTGDELVTIATIETVNHEADTQYLMRAARRAMVQAHQDLKMVAAVQALIAQHRTATAFYEEPGNRRHPAGEVHGLYTALKLIATAYGIEEDQ